MRHLVIPDTQCKPGNSFDHLEWAGKYAVKTKPDVIVHLGDHWDMASLSVYDIGKKSFEGRTYSNDVQAGNNAMDVFMRPIIEEQKRQKENKKKVWNPKKVFLIGNHEYRIDRAVESDRKLEGLVGYKDFNLKKYNWEVHNFLDVVIVNGIAYSHYFTSGVMGRPVSSPQLMLQKKHMSCIMGHVQDRGISYSKKADGSSITGMFAGIFYQHDEEYLNPQTNGSWSGIWMLNEVNNGSFDEMPVSINYLRKQYGN
jgi:predicted MPP superfamily phosphohydrolase